MHSNWLKLVTWLVASNRNALFRSRVLSPLWFLMRLAAYVNAYSGQTVHPGMSDSRKDSQNLPKWDSVQNGFQVFLGYRLIPAPRILCLTLESLSYRWGGLMRSPWVRIDTRLSHLVPCHKSSWPVDSFNLQDKNKKEVFKMNLFLFIFGL